MKRTFFTLLTAGAVSALSAQSTASQTMTGVLMDASCSAVKSSRMGSGADATAGSSASTSVQHSGMTGANSQSTEGSIARTRTEVENREVRMRAGSAQPADRTEQNAANNAGTNGPDRNAGDVAPRRLTETRNDRSQGPDRASASGTTGAAVNTAPPQSGNLQSTREVQGPGAGGAAPANRPRPDASRDTASASTVREKYRECSVKPGTTAFAIHSDGKVYVLDADGNRMVQDQMRNEAFRASMSDPAGGARWITVTVLGSRSGDTLKISSVRR